MRAVSFFRKYHKWLTLIVGVQAVLWTLSGVYMTVIPLDFIHGDHLVRPVESQKIDWNRVSVGPGRVSQNYPSAQSIELIMLAGDPVYRVKSANSQTLVDAVSGGHISPVGEDLVRMLAVEHYAGEGVIEQVTLLEGNLPQEIQAADPPLWRVDFSGANEPTFYFDADTAEFLSRRHNFWRGFDFVWMLHIMDYEDRANVNNWLLRAAASLGLLAAFAGIGLLFFSFGRRRSSASGETG